MLSLRALYKVSLLLLVMAATGCSHIGINESSSIFIGRYAEYMWGDMADQYADLSKDRKSVV